MGVTPLQRVAMLSVHTSPLDAPGGGDAGGMNVYIVETAKRLAAARRRGRDLHPRHRPATSRRTVELCPGVTGPARHRRPVRGPGQGRPARPSCARSPPACCAPRRATSPGWYDVVHSHYWLSGQVGWLARERWGVPLVHSAHTLAKVKNALLADGDAPEPTARVIGEEQVVAEADRLIASTADEAEQLVAPLRRRPGRGAHHRARRRPRRASCPATAAAARARLGLRPGRADAAVRRPHPAAQGARRAAARGRAAAAATRSCAGRLQVVVVGAPSGTGLAAPAAAARRCADELGLGDVVRFVPPAPRAVVADYYRAADLTVVPELQRVVRPGRARVAGLRHAGRRRRRRRPAHRRRRRRFRRARRRARPGRSGPRCSADVLRTPAAARAAGAAAPGRTPSGSPGTARPTACSWPTARRSTSWRTRRELAIRP